MKNRYVGSHRWWLAAAATSLMVSGCSGVQGGAAQEDAANFPSRAVELTVPYNPGGALDLVGRALAAGMEDPLGQPVIVVNKPGGGGVIGAREVLNGPADGYAEVLLNKSQFTISPLVESGSDVLQLDQMKFLAGLTVEEYALVVQADSPYQTLQDLTESAEPITFSHSGNGSGTHYALEVLFKEAGTQATGIPFDGANPSVTALLGGQVTASGGTIAEVMPQIKAGKLRPLATFSETRSEFLPDVSSAREAGYDIVLDQRRIVAAPSGVSDEVAAALITAINTAEETPAYVEFLEANYISQWNADPEETREHLEEDAAAVRKKTEELGVKLQ